MKRIFSVTIMTLILSGCGGGETDSSNQPWYGDGNSKPNTAPKIQISSTQIPGVFDAASESEFTIVDAENNQITVSKTAGPNWVSLEKISNSVAKIKIKPDEVGDFDVRIQVSDGLLTTPLNVVISVELPDIVRVDLPASDSMSAGDKITIRAANSDTEFSVGHYSEEKKVFSFELPISDSSFKSSDLILKTERAGFAPLSSWFGRGDAFISAMGSKVTIPPSYIEKMTPTPESSAILHAMGQYGALGKDADISSWSSISSRVIDVRYLEQLAVTYAMSREVPELFVLNNVLIEDAKRSYDKPLKETRLSEEITDARLKVESLVSEQYWQVLNDRARSKLFSASKPWSSGKWVVSHLSDLHNASSYGFSLDIGTDSICTVAGVVSACEVTDAGLSISRMPIITTWVPSDVIRERLLSKGVSESASDEIHKSILSKKLSGVHISEMYTNAKFRISASTYDQRHILNATIAGAMLVHELSRGVELNFQNPMIAQPLILKKARHWLFKPEIFDVIVPMPNADNKIDSTASWLDLFNLNSVKELDTENTLKDGSLQWAASGWSAEINQTSNTLTFKKDDLEYALTIFDESSPHYDHVGDVHGRQYGAVAALSKGGNVMWTQVVPLFLYPKARCEESPLSKNTCDTSAFVEFSKNKGWLDIDIGRSPLTDGQFDKKRYTVNLKNDDVELLYFDDSGCSKGVEKDKCQSLLNSWVVSSSKKQPGLWVLLSQNGDPDLSNGYRVIKLNNGDFVYFDLKQKRVKHLSSQ